MDGANCRHLLRTRPRGFTQTISLDAILLVSYPPVNCHRRKGLLNSVGAPTVDWPWRHMHGNPVMSGGRQSHVFDATAVALATELVTPRVRLPAAESTTPVGHGESQTRGSSAGRPERAGDAALLCAMQGTPGSWPRSLK